MNPVKPKTESELEGMRLAGRLAAEVLEMIAPQVAVGMTTGEIDRICHDYIVTVQKAIPAPLNYKGFPKSICTSVNEVICHGIPSDSKKLRSGDTSRSLRMAGMAIPASWWGWETSRPTPSGWCG